MRLPQGVANRDVKLENTLLVSTARPLIKLCDFGYSKVRPPHALLLLVLNKQGCSAQGGCLVGRSGYSWYLCAAAVLHMHPHRKCARGSIVSVAFASHEQQSITVRSCRTRSFSRRRGPRLARQRIWRRR